MPHTAESAVGERWAGSRTVFADADDDAEAAPAGHPPAIAMPDAAGASRGMPIAAHAETVVEHLASVADADAGAPAGAAAALASVKWKKLAARALAEAPARALTLKALRRHVAAALSAKGAAAAGVSRRLQAAALLAAVSRGLDGTPCCWR